MPKRRGWSVCQSHGFHILDDAIFYCVYGKVFPNARGRPAQLERRYKKITGRGVKYQWFKCIEHIDCDHQLRIDLAHGNVIQESGGHEKEKDDSIKRRAKRIGKDLKEKLETCISKGVYSPKKIAAELGKVKLRVVYNQLSRNKKILDHVKIGNITKRNEKKLFKPRNRRRSTRTMVQKKNRNQRDRQRRKTTKLLHKQIRELLSSPLEPGKSAFVSLDKGQKICVKIPDTDEAMIKYLEDHNYKATNLSRSDLVLRYSYMFLAKNIHNQVDGKRNKTFGRRLVNLLKDDIQRFQMDGRAETMWTKFFKQTLRQQYFKVADVSRMLDESVSQSVNLNGWEDIRSLERNGKQERGLFPSRSSIQLEQRSFEEGSRLNRLRISIITYQY